MKFIVCGVLILASSWALLPQQDVVMTIKDGMPAISFALPKFIVRSPAAQAASEEIYQVLSADIKYSRIFQLLPQSYYSYIRALDPNNILYKDWKSIQANILFVGEISEIENGTIIFEAKLYDVKSERRILGKRYQANKVDLRFLAHKTADEILKVYGEKPLFISKIAFVSNRDGNDELYMMDYDGANQTRLTFNTVIDYSPAWSPDGTRIAYTSYQQLTAGLYILDVYEGKRAVASTRGGNFSPCWSPDGKKLAFNSSMDGNQEIYVAEIESNPTRTGKIRRLTFNPASDISPAWSSNGREIAFTSDRGGTPQIYIMDAEGSNVRRVSFGGSYHDSPAWAPTGDRIVYVSRVEEIFDLYVLSLRTNQIMKLTENRARNESPNWSPDGRHIVFASNLRGGIQIFAIDSDGASFRQLTAKGQNKLPDWSN
jgi:TolB protein